MQIITGVKVSTGVRIRVSRNGNLGSICSGSHSSIGGDIGFNRPKIL
jgi:hypothetical protein